MKKLLAMVLALVMTLSLAVSANAAFKDVKDIDETYAEAVAVLTGMKVFKGYERWLLPARRTPSPAPRWLRSSIASTPPT